MAKDCVKYIAAKYKSKLKVVHINAQSLNDTAHYAEFCDVFGDGDIDILGVSETFYKDTSQIRLNNYEVLNVNRTGKRGGGVAVYIRNGIEYKLLTTSDGESGKPEYVICEISNCTNKILFACIYRPPHIGHMDVFLNDMYAFLSLYKYTIICGDVNGRFDTEECESKIIENILYQCNLTRVPFGPTYHTTKCDSNLDIIASNCQDVMIDFGQTEASAFSAHDLIYAVYNLSTPMFQPKVITYRDFKNANSEELLKFANELPWENVYVEDDINRKVELFNTNMMLVFDKCVPTKTIKIKKKSEPWMTEEIFKMIKRRNRLRKRWISFHDPEIYEQFRVTRNNVKQKIRNAKVQHYNNLFNACGNAKDMWTAIKSLGVGNQDNTQNLTVPVSDLIMHYTSVSTVKFPEKVQSALSRYPIEFNDHYDKKFYFKYVRPDEIINTLLDIKSSAVGVDNLSLQFIKLCLPVILPVLEHLFNYSLQNSCFPEVWKKANIKPIPKIKNPSTCKDYRPVSILCVLAKAIEKIVYHQTVEFIEFHNILPKYQSGFRKGYSTTTALIKVIDDIRKSADKRMVNILLLLDMSKAFDCVHHTLLIKKLRHINFSSSVVNWFKSYLHDRCTRVFVNNDVKSDWSALETGVPQGSVLGPLLFALYLFDMPQVLKYCRYHQYADDLQLYLEFDPTLYDEACSKVSEDVLSVIEYMCNHNLILNVDKTQVIVLGSASYVKRLYAKADGLTIEIGESLLTCVPVVKNLGVFVDSTLTWNEHCIYVINKVFSVLAQLRRTFSYTPLHIRKMLVQMLVFPHFYYVLPLFTNLSVVNMHKLQRAQNACVRYVCNVNRFQHISPYYKNQNILKLEEMRTLQVCTIMWKSIHSGTPEYLCEYFKKEIVKRLTRTEDRKLFIPTARTEIYKKSFHIEACSHWNKLSLYKIKSMYMLKRYLKSVLIH
jgi:hypothetical protein